MPADSGDGQGVLFFYEFLRALLALARKVAIVQLVVIRRSDEHCRKLMAKKGCGICSMLTLLGARQIAALINL